MIRDLLAFLLAATSLTPAAARCNVTPQALLGAWQAVGDRAFFEQMAFESRGGEQRFDSWLHERPEVSEAQWDLAECALTIREKSGITQTFRVSLRGGQLTLASAGEKSMSTYRKIKEKQ